MKSEGKNIMAVRLLPWRCGLAVLAAALAFAPAALAAAQQAPPRLAGVVVGPDHRAAIFASPDGSWVVVGEGDTVGGFTVLRIIPGGTELAGPDDRRLLAPAPASPPPGGPGQCVAESGLCGQPTQPVTITGAGHRDDPAGISRGMPGTQHLVGLDRRH